MKTFIATITGIIFPIVFLLVWAFNSESKTMLSAWNILKWIYLAGFIIAALSLLTIIL